MTSNILQLRELIPLYLNGGLTEQQVIKFEQVLEKHPELQQELAEFSAINTVFDDIKLPDDDQFAGLFKQIESNIHQQTASQRNVPEPRKSWLNSIRDLFLNPYFSWGVALAQFAIVAVIVLQNPKDEIDVRYQSLSQHTAQQGATVNVVFSDSATLTQLNALLLENQLKIITTPGRGKAFSLAVEVSAEVDQVVEKLRQSDIVRFVEKQ